MRPARTSGDAAPPFSCLSPASLRFRAGSRRRRVRALRAGGARASAGAPASRAACRGPRSAAPQHGAATTPPVAAGSWPARRQRCRAAPPPARGARRGLCKPPIRGTISPAVPDVGARPSGASPQRCGRGLPSRAGRTDAARQENSRPPPFPRRSRRRSGRRVSRLQRSYERRARGNTRNRLAARSFPARGKPPDPCGKGSGTRPPGGRRTPRKAPARRDRRGASRRRHGATGDSAGGRRARCPRTDSGGGGDAGGHRRLASCCDTLNRIRPDVSMTRSLRRGFPAPRRLSTRNLRSAFFAHCQP